jgi:hypothetical protein
VPLTTVGHEVKDLLVGRDTPDTFDEYVSLCIRLDNSWREREQDRQDSKGQTPRISTKSDSTSSSSTAVGTHSGPMDISAGRRGPLTKQEKNHRRDNNLCMYCGKSGHFASTFPESNRNQKGKQRVSTGGRLRVRFPFSSFSFCTAEWGEGETGGPRKVA